MQGITVDDDGRLDLDLGCWTCNYNLRTLALDATCPECGTPIHTTLEHRDGRKTRPFSLYTLSPIMRTIGIVYAVLGPLLIVGMAASAPMEPIEVTHQSGEISDYIGVMLAGRSMWAFYPFLAWSYVAYTALMIRPIPMGRKWWVRAGLVLGCVLGIQYQLIIYGHMMGLSTSFFVAVLVSLFPLGVLAAVVFDYYAKDAKRDPKPRDKRSMKAASISVIVTVSVLFVVGLVSRGLILLPVLFFGPYLMLMCMGAALCRLYRTDFDKPMQRNKPIPAAATAAGYIAAWPIAISQAQIVYNSLPLTYDGCYVCTASAHGHRWLTRAQPVVFADGNAMLVTRQMRTLKAGEHLLAERLPRLHRQMRRVYNRLGPGIASRIRSPWLADVSYLLFVPFAAGAWALLTLLGRSSEIDRAYVGDGSIHISRPVSSPR